MRSSQSMGVARPRREAKLSDDLTLGSRNIEKTAMAAGIM